MDTGRKDVYMRPTENWGLYYVIFCLNNLNNLNPGPFPDPPPGPSPDPPPGPSPEPPPRPPIFKLFKLFNSGRELNNLNPGSLPIFKLLNSCRAHIAKPELGLFRSWSWCFVPYTRFQLRNRPSLSCTRGGGGGCCRVEGLFGQGSAVMGFRV